MRKREGIEPRHGYSTVDADVVLFEELFCKINQLAARTDDATDPGACGTGEAALEYEAKMLQRLVTRWGLQTRCAESDRAALCEHGIDPVCIPESQKPQKLCVCERDVAAGIPDKVTVIRKN